MMNNELKKIEEKIRLAADVDRALPPVFKNRYRSPLGGMIAPDAEVIAERNLYDDLPENYTAEDIKVWEEVCFEWLPILSKANQSIVWWRCSGMGWKRIARNLKEKGYLPAEVHRITLFRYFVKSLEKIKKTCNTLQHFATK